ncbi:hypothetical protein [Pseudoalteromonas sp. G4]|uniref:hypothetical protein n=1 Tax=Pseudoalteromonas sp. G4 TaxID=2992761 RepID=UPI00237EC0F4|nr:hypothetical protein [Pseudoalteromonas sp. G4]MDE3272500.1 hypothetical protein [Pseudoalteromonas sp. G4]
MRFFNIVLATLLVALSACQTAPKKDAEQATEKAIEPVVLSAKEQLLQSANKYQQADVPEAIKPQFERALKLKQAGEFQLAKQHFTNIALQYPTLSGAHLQLAYIAKHNGKQDEYTQHLDAALAANKYNYFAANELALVARENGQFADALALYDQAISSWPGFAPSYINKGILLDIYLGEKAKAKAAYQTYLMLIPQDVPSYRQVSTWLLDLEHQLKETQGASNE